ncbi:MAG: hypothetical protein Q8P46_16705 [Hyphomicrobiales bacterium]|nr:hypothetical protein [Hyphomicrobiales bacterium]
MGLPADFWMTFREWLVVGLTALAAIGAIVTAFATFRMWRGQRRGVAAAKPTVTAWLSRISGRTETPHEIQFNVDDDHLSVWRIKSVMSRYIWRPLISEIESRQRDGGGGTLEVFPKGWKKQIRFDPPIQASTILLRYDCPRLIDFVFVLAMRSSPKETSRIAARIKTRD